jgi:hypothetical protein
VLAPFACMGICRSGARLRDREIETNSRLLPVFPVSPASPVFVAARAGRGAIVCGLRARAGALLCVGWLTGVAGDAGVRGAERMG